MATEYISREAAIKTHCAHCFCVDAMRNPDTCHKGCIEYLNFEEIPAADVRPVVHGKWIDVSEKHKLIKVFRCDQCGEETTDTCMGKPRANFCPNCGADMRGGSHE